jgi:hypothetical protein
MPQSFDQAFDAFVNWQTLIFCLGIYFTTYVVRTVVEVFWARSKKAPLTDSKLWTELVLPVGPIVFGGLLALVGKKFPWPIPALSATAMGRIFYGAICGGVSGWVYSRLRAWLKVAAEGNNAVTPVAQKILRTKTPVPPAIPPKQDPPTTPPAQDAP